MHTIAIYSPKGGVGKSTIAVDLAWRSATLGGKRTLLWDLDMQGGSSFLLPPAKELTSRSMSVFAGKPQFERALSATVFEGLSIIPADTSLRDLPLYLRTNAPRNEIARVISRISGAFDRIILDCPPVQNELSEQAIACANAIVAPITVSPLAARSLTILTTELSRVKKPHPPVLPVVSMFDIRRKEHRLAASGWVKPFPRVPWSQEVESAAFRQAPVGSYSRNSAASESLQSIWEMIELRLERA